MVAFVHRSCSVVILVIVAQWLLHYPSIKVYLNSDKLCHPCASDFLVLPAASVHLPALPWSKQLCRDVRLFAVAVAACLPI